MNNEKAVGFWDKTGPLLSIKEILMKVNLPVHRGEIITGMIADLTYQGNGVLKVDQYPIFVPDTLPGEKVEVQVTKLTQNFAWGRLNQRLTTSPDRVENANQMFLQTGIAPLGHLKYPAQLKFKQKLIQDLLTKAHLDLTVAPTLGMETPYHYRNKAQVPVRYQRGALQTGFYKRGSHDLVPMEDFYIQDPVIDQTIVTVRNLMRDLKLRAYDETKQTGDIKHLMVRRGYYSHQVMVVIVTRTPKLPHAKELVAGMVDQIPGITSIIHNVNAKNTNVVLGPENHVLWGEPTIHDQLLGIDFTISPLSFYQVNPQQTEKLYQAAIDAAELDGTQTVIDAYCGIGTISLAVAKHAQKVYGVEIVPAAIEDAKLNALHNQIENAEFVVGKAEEQMAKWQAAGLKPDVLIVDPPRKGLDEQLIEAAGKMAPQKIVYVSCNPATLVRDLQRLMEQGYRVTKPIQPVDQFPQTTHVESVTVLERDR